MSVFVLPKGIDERNDGSGWITVVFQVHKIANIVNNSSYGNSGQLLGVFPGVLVFDVIATILANLFVKELLQIFSV